jgi:hypothetical protein
MNDPAASVSVIRQDFSFKSRGKLLGIKPTGGIQKENNDLSLQNGGRSLILYGPLIKNIFLIIFNPPVTFLAGKDRVMDKEKKAEMDKKWTAIAARAVTDEDFKAQLVATPIDLMLEGGLTLPEGTEMKVGAYDVQSIPIPSDASDVTKEEVKWWMWRLDSIREFGREKPEKTVGHMSMSAQEADDDESGLG